MTYASAPLLASLFASVKFCHYSYYVIITKYNTFYLLAEITLKLRLRLKNTSHILLMRFLFFSCCYY